MQRAANSAACFFIAVKGPLHRALFLLMGDKPELNG